jgi:cell division protein ZapD
LNESILTFEQPLQERIRLFLRCEALFERFRCSHLAARDIDHHHALTLLVDLYAVISRVDIKRELMGELERQMANLLRLGAQPDVDPYRLQMALDGQRRLLERLGQQTGSLDQRVRDNEFFNSVRQRMALPGGACDFDLPIYHFWLSQPAPFREALLQEWFQPLTVVAEAIAQVLAFARASGVARRMIAVDGYYEQSLDPSRAWQMLRVMLPQGAHCYPEISAGRQRFTIRFLQPADFSGRPSATTRDVAFMLSCCAI